MAKRTQRVKPEVNLEFLKDVNDVNQALAEIASLDRQTGEIERELNADIDRMKMIAESRSAPIKSRREALHNGLVAWVEFNRDLFNTRRSVDLAFGKLGLRRSTTVKPKGRTSWATVLLTVQRLVFTELVRNKAELNREAIEAWPDERLSLIGCERVTSDTIWYETIKEQVA